MLNCQLNRLLVIAGQCRTGARGDHIVDDVTRGIIVRLGERGSASRQPEDSNAFTEEKGVGGGGEGGGCSGGVKVLVIFFLTIFSLRFWR